MSAPSTSSVLWGEWRRGLKDLQNAVLNPFNGVTQVHEEPGTIANPTMQLVTADIQGKAPMQGVQQKESFTNMLDRHGRDPAAAPDRQPERE